MKILITGAKGFIGKNLIARLENIREGKCKLYPKINDIQIYQCDIDTTDEQLNSYVKDCEFVVHLAGVNRPQNTAEFMAGNYGFATVLLGKLADNKNKASIIMSSSVQASLDTDYGKSKKAGEDYLRQYGEKNSVDVFVYRLPNVFGKWCRPNYNSAVATFCNNIANELPITVNDRNYSMTLVYIDDVVDAFVKAICGEVILEDEFAIIPVTHTATLGFVVDNLYNFKKSREDLSLPDMSDEFVKKLYSTYLSYLPADKFAYDLNMHCDERGSFTEFIHTKCNGQVSINVSKPHIIKGEHWHDTKNEKFLVVSGTGVIRFRKIDGEEVIEYFVSGDKQVVVDIPVGYTHNIENIGDTEMVTVMWCNEVFDQTKPDTFFMKVGKEK